MSLQLMDDSKMQKKLMEAAKQADKNSSLRYE